MGQHGAQRAGAEQEQLAACAALLEIVFDLADRRQVLAPCIVLVAAHVDWRDWAPAPLATLVAYQNGFVFTKQQRLDCSWPQMRDGRTRRPARIRPGLSY